jgi:hypothetical protein
MTPTRFPDSETSGSTVVCTSPKLIAAYHVLHRFRTPRHPPCALINLTKISANNAGRLRDLRVVKGLKMLALLSPLCSCQRARSLSSPGREAGGSVWIALVEITGIEPVTSGLQSRRSPN